MINEGDKPALNELAHHGVLGMKWGKSRAKATTAEIHTARAAVKKQAAGVAKQAEVARKAKTPSDKIREHDRLDKMDAKFLKNPDRVIAARMTRGEKFATLIGSGVVLPGAGIIPGAIAVAGTSARSRRIERKQEKGKYNLK